MADRNKTTVDPVAGYAAEQGCEDRDGEMTGAITVNMILSMVPVAAWCFFIGPALLGFAWTMAIGVTLAIVLPLSCQRLSRKLWAMLSRWAESM